VCGFFGQVERVAWAVANISMTTVSWLVVIVTLARYCAICRPLDTLQIGRSKRVRKVSRCMGRLIYANYIGLTIVIP